MTKESTTVTIEDHANFEEPQVVYPGLLERIQATITDSVFVIVFMLGITYLFSMFGTIPDEYRMAAFIFIAYLYEPLFVSLMGGTIGHKVVKIQVKRKANPTKNIILPLAFLRFTVKVLLGWISLITVATNSKRQAIHDMVVGSIVLYVPQNDEAT